MRDYVEVAGRTAAAPGLALAGQPDAARVLHGRGDVHPVALDLHGLAAALAGGARICDLRAGAAAERTRLRDREEPLALRLDAADLAARAHLRCRARLRAGAAAGRTSG